MKAQAGDSIVVESEKTAQAHRTGTVEAVLAEEPLRVQVRWEDGHTSILSPADGAARIAPAPRKRSRSKAS